MDAIASQLMRDIEARYRVGEYPALAWQYRKWSREKPLEGRIILDGAPVFRNTCAKYAALLAAGAQLHIARPGLMPHDGEVLARLEEYGIPVVDPAYVAGTYDVVLDCAGYLSHVPSRYGYVELTRSGDASYRGRDVPVFMVDAGLIKQIETCLGTGESFFRAMDSLGLSNWEKGGLLVIGYGKVGRGIVLYARERGICVTVADVEPKKVPGGVSFVPVADRARFNRVLQDSGCAVTATGVAHAMEGLVDAEALAECPVWLANMGVEDEWGPSIPDGRMLNGKSPLNFILEDPTQMCFIDPPLALHNIGACELIAGRCACGLNPPAMECEEEVLSIVRREGVIPGMLLDYLKS